ncbi:atherin-like [Mustela erminea]|uniref:atherin-like n=1 Tax=Mustela erminea TaxID=36723 RepID=UPI0013869552|nr:atherin-like [Mustela erminea]
MDNDIPIPLLSSFLKVTCASADVCPRFCTPDAQRGGTAGLPQTRVSRPAPFVIPRACSAPAPPPPCPSAPPQARPAPPTLPRSGPAPPPQASPARQREARPARLLGCRALRRYPGASRLLPAPQQLSQLAPPPPERSFRLCAPLLPRLQQPAVSSPWRRCVSGSRHRTSRDLRAGLAFGVCPADRRCERTTSGFALRSSTAAEAAREKVQKYKQNGRLLVFDSTGKVMIEPNEAMSE